MADEVPSNGNPPHLLGSGNGSGKLPASSNRPARLRPDAPPVRKPIQLLDLDKEECWLRIRGESGLAFAAFQKFRDMEPEARRLSVVSRELHKSVQLLNRWCQAWAWHDRVYAWDRYQDRLRLSKRLNDRGKMEERHINASIIVQQKVVQRLQAMEPEKMGLDELTRILTRAVHIERLSRGEATEITDGQIDVNVKGKVLHGHINLGKLSDEKLRALEQLIEEASDSAPDEEGDQG